MKHKIFIWEFSGLLILLCGVLILHGCVSFKPSHGVDFKKIGNLSQLEGIYQNLGIYSESTQYPIYLSELIWKTKMDHSAISAVEVRVQSENTLIVKALKEGSIIKESTFIEGKDFDIRNGRIRLKRNVAIHPEESDDPLVGVYYESIELGLDREGHGKYRNKWFATGLAFLLVPLAVGESVEVKFVKIKD